MLLAPFTLTALKRKATSLLTNLLDRHGSRLASCATASMDRNEALRAARRASRLDRLRTAGALPGAAASEIGRRSIRRSGSREVGAGRTVDLDDQCFEHAAAERRLWETELDWLTEMAEAF